MLKTLFITLLIGIIGFIVFEILEHVVVPLAWIILRRKKSPATGPEALLGRVVEVKQWEKKKGLVSVRGELWQAFSETPLLPGDKAIIHRVEGLTLSVKPLDAESKERGSW